MKRPMLFAGCTAFMALFFSNFALVAAEPESKCSIANDSIANELCGSKCSPTVAGDATAGGKMRISKSSFGKTTDGQSVELFECVNKSGLVLKMITFGATVVELHAPDRDGKLANITLGFDSIAGYLGDHPYFGSTIGRYGNRIGNATFTLDGKQYDISANDDVNHLHGGEIGFDAVVWKAESIKTDDSVGVKFTYSSKDGDQGFPGTLKATVVYRLTNDDALCIDYRATTDKATPVNLTNHTYWNLGGAGSGQILDHWLMLTADKFLPVDANLIPTGDLAPVAATPFDFTAMQAIGSRIGQVKADPPGYDNCFVLRNQDGSMALAARVVEPKSGRVLEIYTTQPGIQFYTGNFLDGEEARGGNQRHDAFCLETQHYPDSPNQPSFPSSILRPGETYHESTIHKFRVRK